MLLFVQRRPNKSIVLEIDADQDTILTVKQQIQQQTGILPENQILKFGQSFLNTQTVLNDDQKTLRDYGIVIDESSIDLTSPGNEAAVDEDDIFDIDGRSSSSPSWSIYIKPLSGKLFSLQQVDKDKTFQQLKEDIYIQQGIPIDHQCLYDMDGRSVVDTETLRYKFAFTDNVLVYLAVRAPSGKRRLCFFSCYNMLFFCLTDTSRTTLVVDCHQVFRHYRTILLEVPLDMLIVEIKDLLHQRSQVPVGRLRLYSQPRHDHWVNDRTVRDCLLHDRADVVLMSSNETKLKMIRRDQEGTDSFRILILVFDKHAVCLVSIGETMQIHIQMSKGHTFLLEVEESFTIYQVKQRIEELQHIDKAHQKLYFTSIPLSDDRGTLCSYGVICDRDVLTLVIRRPREEQDGK
jgi:hypothetical protein